jgi:hypothetical protein
MCPECAISALEPRGLRHDSGLLEHALFFAGLGLQLFPVHTAVRSSSGQWLCSCGHPRCGSPAKHPIGRLVPQGMKNASSDRKTVERWFSASDRNIGIATGRQSGLVVLDVDPRHGGDESLAALEAQYGSLPSTWRFLTGGGGEHIFFRHPGVAIGNSAGVIGPGLDLRGDGGYIVAPPSVHISGKRYSVSVDHSPDEVELAPMPDWLLALCRKATTAVAIRPGAKPASPFRLLGSGIGEGMRNITLTQMAGTFVSRRMRPADVLDLISFINRHACAPPLDDGELLRIVASIVTREQAKDFFRE